jgi:hypothetical protein
MPHVLHLIAFPTINRKVLFIAVGVLLVIAAAYVLSSSKRRKNARRVFYLSINVLIVDIGLRGIARLLIISALAAVLPALRAWSNGGFDTHLFFSILAIAFAATILLNFLNTNARLRDFFSPKAGRKWLNERKSAQAGIIKKINLCLIPGTAPSDEQLRRMLRDILDVIVLHVRDYRGSHNDRRREVFANLLIQSGEDELTVIIRDSMSHASKYKRQTPMSYTKSGLACGWAMDRARAVSVGMLSEEYPDTDEDKPYESILALPLFSTDADLPYGCVSIDCSRPYFFQSFTPDQSENEMENSLQPYLQLITLVIECFIGRSLESKKQALKLGVKPEEGGS